jgi:crotonobetainyl-CoA:carnitine CoA-transferase CaiB-like acyl-CoA transferase
VSLGDSLSALHGVIGVMLALRHREQNGGAGQEIDVALYESVFNMMESLIPEYSVFGAVREPAGSSLLGIAPTNAYRCQDGKYALIAGNGDSIYRRLMEKIDRLDLANDPELSQNDGRVRHVARIDAAISTWTAERSLDDVLAALKDANIPSGKIYDASDIAADPHYQAREMLLASNLDDGTPVTLPGIVPKLSLTPGRVKSRAPTLGQHTDSVLEGLGIDASTRESWRARGLI